MSTYTIGQYFEDYREHIPSQLENGRLLKLVFSEDMKKLECTASYEKLVDFDNICHFEHDMKNILRIDDFKLFVKYTPDMLCKEYFGELCKFMKSRFPFVNGFLDNAEAEYSDGVFKITLKRGGLELMEKAGVYNCFSALINELFSAKAAIEFDGKTTTDIDEHNKAQDEFLSSIPLPDLKEPPAPQPNNASGSGQAHGEQEFRTVSVDFTGLDIIGENALVLKGGPILSDTRISSMASLPNDIDALEHFNDVVTVWGDVFQIDADEKKSGMLIAELFFTDYTSSYAIKMLGFVKGGRNSRSSRAQLEAILEKIKKGSTIIVRGKVQEDDFNHKIYLIPDDIMLVKREQEKDNAEEKRVELHCHTNMSLMDALASPDKLVAKAFGWGHKALAITDHGVVQGFPAAGNKCADIRRDNGDF